MKTKTISISLQELKEKATELKAFIDKGEGKTISRSACLQIVAVLYDFPGWNHANAYFKEEG